MRIVLSFLILLVAAEPTAAQDFNEQVRGFIDKASEAAAALVDSEARILEQFEQARDREGAEMRLRELEASMNEAAATYGPDSEIWLEHDKLVAFVDEQRANAAEKLSQTGESRWQEAVVDWDSQKAALQELRLDIISEADRSAELARGFSGEIDYILDLYLREGVAAAIAELELVKSNLIAMNDGVEGALETARKKFGLPETSN